ncbi:hypothetical protein TVAG_263310 [Trichomonas vaginalis G3]|uniref:Uncharacterized protein n=1 Tax=Trichomonas vaginalis (strain ATCC PRA-98 / G3) TaxID=412133 RepID=A2FA78_TRIV3|nr:hypothetical protein TVAGG3_0390840 [Trichomonas vaginalis G3]EAX98214.1 hypothetical protein TVAG_263310 [Trichomonas vaginalis G3]KAI5533980.1 hypothetical protein TVAGG3_0390840 [Trichomonas vaginalis G3]|eukprot:XP_001311144.1 hypothetical protein [Trichomonas vaginalis G3]
MISRRTSTPLHQEDLQVTTQKSRNYVKRKTICTIVGVVKDADSNILQEPKEKILSDSELKRLWRLVNAHLHSDGRENLSYPTEWISNSESQKVLDLIHSLSESVKKIKNETQTAQYTKEGLLLDQTADLKEQIRKLERKIDYKQQHLSEIGTEISKLKLEMGKEKKLFIQKEKPKLAQLAKLQKRIELLKKE